MSRLSVVGFPSSAGSYAAGQDLAPAALRAAGLIEALARAGVDVHDDGNLPAQVWHPDREHPLAQNVGDVVSGLQSLAARLRPLFERGDRVLVLGGDCTIVLAAMAALADDDQMAGLAYFDRHYDLNTPSSTTDGALDWMGLAHGLDLPNAIPELVAAFGRRPLLVPSQIAWLGVESEPATNWEQLHAASLELHVATSEALAAEPAAAASAALRALPTGPLAVHIDVDVLDFTDAPLAENTDGRNTGPNLDQLAAALETMARDPRMRALTIGELNPTRSAGDSDALTRFIQVIVRVLSEPSDGAFIHQAE